MSEVLDPVTVLAVDDHPHFLDAARAVVEATPGFSWLGGVASGAEALATAARHEPDLMLVDVNMPVMNGFQLAYELGTSHPGTLVALVTAQHPDELPRGVGDSPRPPVLAKENLRPAWLRALWREHGGTQPARK